MGCGRWQDDTLILDIRLQPHASRDEIIGNYAGRLKVRLAAPRLTAPNAGAPGEANQSLLKYLAKIYHTPLRQVSLLDGTTCRKKCVGIEASCHLPEGAHSPQT